MSESLVGKAVTVVYIIRDDSEEWRKTLPRLYETRGGLEAIGCATGDLMDRCEKYRVELERLGSSHLDDAP